MGMFEYVKIKEAIGKVQDAIGKVQDSVGKIYDDIKAIPKTSGAMNAGEFKEKAIHLGSGEKDITNCVFSVTGKGKLHAAWLAGVGSGSTYRYRWGLKVVIDDEVVFDVQKKSFYENIGDYAETVGFITSGLYSSGTSERISFVAPNGINGGSFCQAPFYTLANKDNVGSFDANGVGGNNSSVRGFCMCVIPDKPCTSYTLAGRTSTDITAAAISVGSVIPEPLIFNKSIKVYASNKASSDFVSIGIVRVAYTLEG